MTELPFTRIIDFIPKGWCETPVGITDQKKYVSAYNYIEEELGSWSGDKWRSYRSAWQIIFKEETDALKFKLMGF